MARRPRPGQRKQQQRSGEGGEEAHKAGNKGYRIENREWLNTKARHAELVEASLPRNVTQLAYKCGRDASDSA
ncbi:hypothetical protein GCM10022409_13120 [Hymenobacter glaciei]|uniref:Uncharacterized protein n=1 Tax=Hymenobacter glaciei TaxID=877209 RepID=A0ABP7TRP1_9BACT